MVSEIRSRLVRKSALLAPPITPPAQSKSAPFRLRNFALQAGGPVGDFEHVPSGLAPGLRPPARLYLNSDLRSSSALGRRRIRIAGIQFLVQFVEVRT